MKIKDEHIAGNDTTVYDISLNKTELDLVIAMALRLRKELPKTIETSCLRNRLRNMQMVYNKYLNKKYAR